MERSVEMARDLSGRSCRGRARLRRATRPDGAGTRKPARNGPARRLRAHPCGRATRAGCAGLGAPAPLRPARSRGAGVRERGAVFAVLAATVALMVLAIRFALRPERDPLRLPERWRTVYVYLAEVLLVLFFTHIRFNVPELFIGAAVRYWTFAVMGLAFVGIGLAEFFERRKIEVLAIPLRRTGVLLPLIPLLAFWAKPPAALTEFAA